MPIPKPGSPVRGSATGRPIMALLDLLSRRQALRILWELREDPLRFRDLQARAETSPSVLNTRLGELREALIVELAPEGYRLTDLGRDEVAQAQLGAAARPHPGRLGAAAPPPPYFTEFLEDSS